MRIHTPPSRQMIRPKITNPHGNRAAPMGHKDATIVLGEPDEINHVTVERCPECSHARGTSLRTEKWKILGIPPSHKLKVIEYDIDVYKCGRKVKSVHRDCPQAGDIGIYLLKYIIMLKYNLWGPIGRVQEFLMINNNLDLNVKEINDALIRVGDACKSEYYTIQNRVRRSKWVHNYETGFHVNGKKF